MKLLLLTFVVCFAAALAAPADKQKRDILPGDPRYGTDHHHEHHHEHENEIQISKAAGGYVGSYTVPDDTVPEDHSFQAQPQSSYGLPSQTPGKPLGTDLFVSDDAAQNPLSINVPSTSYGIPDTIQTTVDLNTNYQTPSVQTPVTSYDIKHEKFHIPHTSYGTPVVKTTVQEQPKFDTVHVEKTVVPEVHHEIQHVQQPAVVHNHVETVPHSVALPQVKVTTSHVPTETQGAVHNSVPSFISSFNSFPTSYASYPTYSSYSNLPVKTLDHHVQVQVPHPYHVPVTKHVPYPVAVPQTVEIPKPYYVRVPQPVQVTVNRPYPVEVPRPVPYPVPHYVKTNVPFAHQHHVTVDAIKANPLQTFFDNSQLTFQNVVSGLPTFSNPLESFQNSFENFQFPSFPSLPSFPSIPFLPQQPQTVPATSEHVNVPSSTISDSVTIDNPALKGENTVTKPVVQQITNHIKPAQQVYKPSIPCAGCTVSGSSKQEFVQPTDPNGGYVY